MKKLIVILLVFCIYNVILAQNDTINKYSINNDSINLNKKIMEIKAGSASVWIATWDLATKTIQPGAQKFQNASQITNENQLAAFYDYYMTTVSKADLINTLISKGVTDPNDYLTAVDN